MRFPELVSTEGASRDHLAGAPIVKEPGHCQNHGAKEGETIFHALGSHWLKGIKGLRARDAQ